MTKTLRDNCDINILLQTSCETLFPDVQMKWIVTKFCGFMPWIPVMESRDASRDPIFWSLGLEGLRFCLGLEGSRSRALRLETLHRLFFTTFCKMEFFEKRFQK